MLRWYQKEAVQSVFDYYASGKRGNIIVALPTGTGKSHVMAEIQHRAIKNWPDQRFVNLAHDKRLIEQNYNKLVDLGAPSVGIYSAGLGRKEFEQDIVFAGIASIAKNPELLGHRDLIIIDECHMVSPNDQTMYNKVVSTLKEINPKIKVIGLTATPYRMKGGHLLDGDLFNDVVYDLTNIDGFNKLLDDGFIAPLITKSTCDSISFEGLSIRGGDFIQLEVNAAIKKQGILIKALKEFCKKGSDRKSWLIFANGIENGSEIEKTLQSWGISAICVHSKLSQKECDQKIADFRAGKYRAIINSDMLTTGFDHPPIDLIGCFRLTMSTGLWVQMLGRGTRIWGGGELNGHYFPQKENCLVLDYAKNIERLGPINDPTIPKKPRKGNIKGDAPIRICGECGTYHHMSVKKCTICDFEFPTQIKIKAKSSTGEVIAKKKKREDRQIIKFKVDRVEYSKHIKISTSSESLKVTYFCGVEKFLEWITFNKSGFPLYRARKWWAERSATTLPTSVDAALKIGNFKSPKSIFVHINKKYPEIVSHEF